MPRKPLKPCSVCRRRLTRERFCSVCGEGSGSSGWSDRRRGSRHERGYGSAWDKLRKEVLERDRGLCQACQAEGVTNMHGPKNRHQVDHRIPIAEGGSDDLENLQTLCIAHHQAKTAREAARGVHQRGAGSKV